MKKYLQNNLTVNKTINSIDLPNKQFQCTKVTQKTTHVDHIIKFYAADVVLACQKSSTVCSSGPCVAMYTGLRGSPSI